MISFSRPKIFKTLNNAQIERWMRDNPDRVQHLPTYTPKPRPAHTVTPTVVTRRQPSHRRPVIVAPKPMRTRQALERRRAELLDYLNHTKTPVPACELSKKLNIPNVRCFVATMNKQGANIQSKRKLIDGRIHKVYWVETSQ